MPDALTINGTPYGVEVGGWVESDDYPAQTEPGLGGVPASPVTAARDHDRGVRFRSVDMARADAVALETVLSGGLVTLAGELPGGERTAVADDVVLEPWDDDPTGVAAVSCLFLMDPEEEES
jgi:hypothetical protein